MWHEGIMSNQADHTIVRLRVPPELKIKIEESAEKNNRSQSAEMVARLEKSFEEIPPHKYTENAVAQVLEKSIAKLLDSMKNQGASNEMIETALKDLVDK